MGAENWMPQHHLFKENVNVLVSVHFSMQQIEHVEGQK